MKKDAKLTNGAKKVGKLAVKRQLRHADREATNMNSITNLTMLVKQFNGNHYST
jgi:hypothetical protein